MTLLVSASSGAPGVRSASYTLGGAPFGIGDRREGGSSRSRPGCAAPIAWLFVLLLGPAALAYPISDSFSTQPQVVPSAILSVRPERVKQPSVNAYAVPARADVAEALAGVDGVTDVDFDRPVLELAALLVQNA